MGRVAKLIMVTGANNNKYYDMEENGDTIQVKYGRVGGHQTSATYSPYQWDRLLNSKIRKGYKDVTSLRTVIESADFTNITDDKIEAIVTRLQAFANKSVSTNYMVASEAVTQKQVDEAQALIDALMKVGSKKTVIEKKFNDNLIELYQVIPRRMARVGDHLLGTDTGETDPLKIISQEQAALDVMKGQVHVSIAKQNNTQGDSKTILEAMGLGIEVVTPKDVELIKKNLGQVAPQYKSAYKVKNLKSQDKYDKWIKKAKNKKSMMFWHGSRNENWWSILDSGLVLRPTNAVITGKMFGYGLYFADSARKSFNYTSHSGSYWARGTSTTGFMCLYDVHLGDWLHIKHHEGWHSQLTEKRLKNRGSYDSLFAEGGADLRNNEYIVYNEAQCTPRYLVELGK